MAIGSINGYTPRYSGITVPEPRKNEQTDNKPVEQIAANKSDAASKQDAFVRSADSKPVVYGKSQTGTMSATQMRDLEEQRVSSFQEMLRSMVTKQGQKGNLAMFGMEFTVTKEDSAKAASEIAPGGEWSVESVAGRLMDMAKALAGGDASKISTLRNAVEKGFQAAGVDFGGKLPSISQDTHTEVMKRFDDWEKEMSKTGAIAADA